MCRVMNVQLDEAVRDNDGVFYVPIFDASFLTRDWKEIRFYIWRGSDRSVIVESQ